MLYRSFSLLFVIFFLSACDYRVSSEFVEGVHGRAEKQTAIEIDTEGNMFGYYEYLPKGFDATRNKKYPLVFYWNGQNSIAGDGKAGLKGLLTQGLPEYINDGRHFPAIIISAQMKYGDWKTIDIHPFVEYIEKRYKQHIDFNRIYMTGFSAGGGLTMRYAMEHPEKLAAIVPVAPAIRYPKKDDPSEKFAKVSSWIFHNKGDGVVEHDRSLKWQAVLQGVGADHKFTFYNDEGHYAWYKAYADQALWVWLLSQTK